jgi:phage/plasmid-associated DNA primase
MRIKDFIQQEQIPYLPIVYYMKDGVKKPLGEKNDLSNEEILYTLDKIENLNPDEKQHRVYDFYNSKVKNTDLLIKINHSHKKCYSLFLKHTNIVCIDIDEENIKDINDLNDNFNIVKSSYYTKGNTKGIHIYIKCNDLPKYSNQQDIINDYKGDLIKINNTWERIEKEIYNEKILSLNFDDIKHLFNIDKMGIKAISNTPAQQPIKQEIMQPKKIDKNTDGLLEDIIMNLNISRCQTFNDWLCVGMALKPYNNFNLWVEFSKRDITAFNKPNNESYMNNQWNRFRFNNCYNLYSLLKWLKEDNIKEYERINKDYEEIINKNEFYKTSLHIANYLIENIYNNKIYFIEKDIYYIFNNETFLYEDINENQLKTSIKNILIKIFETNNIKFTQKKENKIIGHSNLSNIIKDIEATVHKFNFIDILDNQPNVLNFKNGLLDLRTLKFRQRNENDYFSKCLNYDYNEIPNIDLINEIKNDLLLNFNNDENILNDVLTFYGYAITGEKNKSDVLFNIGYGGGNGKTTISHILLKYVLNIYCSYTNGDTFLLGIDPNNRSKTISELENKIRLLFIEEFDEMKLDIAFIKELSGGDIYEYKPLFSKKSKKIQHYVKLCFIGNKDPNFKSDKAMNRRGRLVYYNNKFVSKKYYDEHHETEKNIYIANPNLLNKYKKDEYKNAFIHLLINYSKKFYDTDELNYITDIEKAFEEVNENNNTLELYLKDNIEFTKNEKDCINKQELLNNYLGYYNFKIKLLLNDFIKEMKKYKNVFYLNFDASKYKDGKGCYIGIKFKQHNENENNNIDL